MPYAPVMNSTGMMDMVPIGQLTDRLRAIAAAGPQGRAEVAVSRLLVPSRQAGCVGVPVVVPRRVVGYASPMWVVLSQADQAARNMFLVLAAAAIATLPAAAVFAGIEVVGLTPGFGMPVLPGFDAPIP